MGIFGNSFLCSSIYYLSILLCNWWLGNEIYVFLPCIPRKCYCCRRILYRFYYSSMATNFLYSFVCYSLFYYCIQRCWTRNWKVFKNFNACFSCNCFVYCNLFFVHYSHRCKWSNSYRFARCCSLLCSKFWRNYIQKVPLHYSWCNGTTFLFIVYCNGNYGNLRFLHEKRRKSCKICKPNWNFWYRYCCFSRYDDYSSCLRILWNRRNVCWTWTYVHYIAKSI